MAKLSYTGYDETMASVNRRGSVVRAKIERALRESAEALTEALVHEEMASFKAPTGEMGRLIAGGERSIVHGSESSIEVWPGEAEYVGRRGRPRRASTVDFVIEAGHGNVPANPWNRRARNKAKTRINAIIAEALREEGGA